MDKQQIRRMLESEYRSYLDLVNSHGLSWTGPTGDDEISKLSDSDLAIFVKKLKDLARTPTE